MKYFNPSYWFKLWLLSAPLLNDKTQGINAKSIDNKNIKDWTSNNTNLQSINQEITLSNNQTINPFYQAELKASNYEHQHEKIKNRHKRKQNNQKFYKIKNNYYNEYFFADSNSLAYDSSRRMVLTSKQNWNPDHFIWKLEKYNQDDSLYLIKNNYYNDIKNAIIKKYPNLKIDGIRIVGTPNYSNFCACFTTKIHISKPKEICFYGDYGKLPAKFTYITKTKLNEISKIIANDPKSRQWIEHITQWNSTLPQAIESAKTFTPQALYNWKRQEKETIKGYIRDWSHILTLIENELKIDELNKNIQGLKSDFDKIKTQVNNLENNLSKLNERVTKIENSLSSSSWNCANIATISAGVFSVIPEVGTIAGGVATVTAGACAIAGV